MAQSGAQRLLVMPGSVGDPVRGRRVDVKRYRPSLRCILGKPAVSSGELTRQFRWDGRTNEVRAEGMRRLGGCTHGSILREALVRKIRA